MRSVVYRHVREQQSAKRGGGEVMVTLTTDIQGEVLETNACSRSIPLSMRSNASRRPIAN